jgi:hypothetical protein
MAYPKEQDGMSDKIRGSVMVVGGGIAGMQASLDLNYFTQTGRGRPAFKHRAFNQQ